MKSFYVINNKIIHLPSIRDITLSERENRIYVSYQNGDTRGEVLQFMSNDEAGKAFAEFASILTQEV